MNYIILVSQVMGLLRFKNKYGSLDEGNEQFVQNTNFEL